MDDRLKSDMEPQFPGNDIPCRTCQHKDAGKIGYKKSRCWVYADGKPRGILFDGEDCPRYVREAE